MKRFCSILVALALACLGVSACNKADTNQTPTPTSEEELEAALPKLFGTWNTATTDGVYYTVEIAREQIHLRKSVMWTKSRMNLLDFFTNGQKVG